MNTSDDDNEANQLDLSHITPWHKYTVGSAFVLKKQMVADILSELYERAKQPPTDIEHFNQTTLYVWLVFCLLTGVRPNNNLFNINDVDIDIEGRWLIIDDKPNRNTKSHRLIPLCQTLVRLLSAYCKFLETFQLTHQQHHAVNDAIDAIRQGDDVSMLRLMSDEYASLTPIKRGDIYHRIKDIVDLDPYWTRHFVRTQLEKAGVNIELINAIIGHEKSRQQALGEFASLSKHDIRQVADRIDDLANQLGLDRQNPLPTRAV